MKPQNLVDIFRYQETKEHRLFESVNLTTHCDPRGLACQGVPIIPSDYRLPVEKVLYDLRL